MGSDAQARNPSPFAGEGGRLKADQMRGSLWWVPEGLRPTPDEGLARLDHLRAHGDSDRAFGWDWLAEAKLHRERSCRIAAE